MKTAEDRFWANVDKNEPNDCWIWSAHKNNGYGQIMVNGKPMQAHRFSYELAKGQIPNGLTIDHLCRNHACVNPDHLESVTQRENTLRGIGPTSVNANKTHCPRGHPLVEGNLVKRPFNHRNERACKTCHNAIANRTQKLRRAKAKVIQEDV